MAKQPTFTFKARFHKSYGNYPDSTGVSLGMYYLGSTRTDLCRIPIIPGVFYHRKIGENPFQYFPENQRAVILKENLEDAVEKFKYLMQNPQITEDEFNQRKSSWFESFGRYDGKVNYTWREEKGKLILRSHACPKDILDLDAEQAKTFLEDYLNFLSEHKDLQPDADRLREISHRLSRI